MINGKIYELLIDLAKITFEKGSRLGKSILWASFNFPYNQKVLSYHPSPDINTKGLLSFTPFYLFVAYSIILLTQITTLATIPTQVF